MLMKECHIWLVQCTHLFWTQKLVWIENKIPGTSCLVTTTDLNTEVGEVENKIPDCAKYISTQKFNKLTAESSAVRF